LTASFYVTSNTQKRFVIILVEEISSAQTSTMGPTSNPIAEVAKDPCNNAVCFSPDEKCDPKLIVYHDL
jgi:hypothetical protein